MRFLLESIFPKLRRPVRPPRYTILIGVHHKTGTVWMRSTFSQIAAELGYRFCEVKNKSRSLKADILFANHSRFPAEILAKEFRGLHLIRDPRDIVLSGLNYHLNAKEGWLLKPEKKFEGQSYQQALTALPVDRRFEFELENVASHTFEQLRAWNYEDPRFYELRYEDLINDVAAIHFRKVLAYLAIPEDLIGTACQIFEQNSLFNKNARTDLSGHIRDGRARQWATHMTRTQGERFVESGGDLLVALGYERNHDWILKLES